MIFNWSFSEGLFACILFGLFLIFGILFAISDNDSI